MKYTIKDFLAGKVSILCNNADESNAVLKVCKENGVTWRFGRPIRRHIPLEPVLTVGYFNDGCLTHGDGCHPGMIVVNCDEIDFSDAPRYQIIIESDGDTTTAKMIVNGREAKQATAKRNPADKANWRMGAQTAFDRLWVKQPKPEKPAEKGGFKVGDRVVCTATHLPLYNKRGRIVAVAHESNFIPFAVEFDECINGHNCGGVAKKGCGYWLNADDISHEQPTTQKVREVKRIAEVGEYVKLTKANFWFMKRGDIVRVSSVWISDGSATVRECDLARPSGSAVAPNYEWNIYNDYVVLEGYQPGRDGK